jgi:hypothetical protein
MTAMEALLRRLRGGIVKQIQGALGTPDGGRCCLGVVCDVAREYGVIDAPRIIAPVIDQPDKKLLEYAGHTGALPFAVQKFFGFTTPSGSYLDTLGEEQSLLNDNDNKLLTFVQIADIIESKPEGLFTTPPAPALTAGQSL